MIPVTKPFLPPIDEYNELIGGIWDRQHLTNNGPLVRKLEAELINFLGLDNILFVNNGTIALQIAIKALGLEGEIITTPFSYVATTSSIVWENCSPIFVDIDTQTFNIDPELIEAAITDRTTGILATHVFGNPCDIDAIQKIADKNNLKVIYDAAHCFGTNYKGKSVFEFGDISTTSFHATKLFQTIEGGAIFSTDENLHKRMWYMRNFGHDGQVEYNGVGINGKNSEFHAAMGICNVKYIQQILDKRKAQCNLYNSFFFDNAKVKLQQINDLTDWNFSYYPLVFESVKTCEKIIVALHHEDVYPRRYFYPSLSSLDYVKESDTPVSDTISSRILCLPLYHELKNSDIRKISTIILGVLDG